MTYQTIRWNLGKPMSVNWLKMNWNIKSFSPPNPNLTQAGWDPLLTSWPEDSAAGPPHCHSYGVVSCVNPKWKEKRVLRVCRGKWSEHRGERDSVTEMMQGGGERERERLGRERQSLRRREHQEEPKIATHTSSYMIRHVALPLWEHIDWDTLTGVYIEIEHTVWILHWWCIVRLNKPGYCLSFWLWYWSCTMWISYNVALQLSDIILKNLTLYVMMGLYQWQRSAKWLFSIPAVSQHFCSLDGCLLAKRKILVSRIEIF